jgi:hypothetical protein
MKMIVHRDEWRPKLMRPSEENNIHGSLKLMRPGKENNAIVKNNISSPYFLLVTHE